MYGAQDIELSPAAQSQVDRYTQQVRAPGTMQVPAGCKSWETSGSQMFLDWSVKSSFAERNGFTHGSKLWRTVQIGLDLLEQNGFNLESNLLWDMNGAQNASEIVHETVLSMEFGLLS